MPPSFTAATRDSLSNLAASLGAGRDKAAQDAFVLWDLDRSQIEAMHRGDWLARKIVDIVPYDMVREWRAWSGHAADVARVEAAERRLGLRKALQRAMVLGRLYGGGALVIGTGETDPAALARPLDPDSVGRGGLKFLHVVSRFGLNAPAVDRDPLSPWYGDAVAYELVAPGRGALVLHPSRVVRFLGNPLPDPSLATTVWSDSVLQVLYDAIHAVALTTAGATSLMHEAKVDIVTVPNLSEHLGSADTTAQLSARFAYAAAMKSINNLLLLGDGETWARQSVDFAGLPEMVRTFLQVAAGAADIPVTRLLGQSPAGLSATGDSDTRNYYDMIAGRQELDLRPQLERLDRLILRSEGIDPDALTFAFRPLWQMDAATQAALALSKAQATQFYAGLGLWPTAITARLVEAQLVADGTYPNAAAVFGADGKEAVGDSLGATEPRGAPPSFWPNEDEPRDWHGRWMRGMGPSPAPRGVHVAHVGEDPYAGGDPDIEENLQRIEREQNPPLRIGPNLIPRERSDGTLEIGGPTIPPLLGPRFPPASSKPPPVPTQQTAPATPGLIRPGVMPPPGKPTEPVAPSGRPGVPKPAGGRLGLPGTPTTLEAIEVPPGLTLKAQGGTIKQKAISYESEARTALKFDPAPPGYKKGEKVPDGLMEDPQTGLEIALEVKYLNVSKKGLRDPERNIAFINRDDFNQARKYLDEFKGGLLWVVNNEKLAVRYSKLFEDEGLSGFRIVFIPSEEE